MNIGEPCHGERVIDGAANTATALTLFKSGHFDDAGDVVERTLQSDEFLNITDVVIIDEEAADVSLLADTAAAGKYIVLTKTAAGVPIVIHFNTPYVCPMGVVPKFTGGSGAAARSMCVIQGFISN